jgi:hypothetical protein
MEIKDMKLEPTYRVRPPREKSKKVVKKNQIIKQTYLRLQTTIQRIVGENSYINRHRRS